MTDKEKEEEIKMKGQAKSAFTGFLADPTSARKPKDFENHFPGGKIDLKSLNNKDKDWAEKDFKKFTIHEVGVMISTLSDHNIDTTQCSLYKIDLDMPKYWQRTI